MDSQQRETSKLEVKSGTFDDEAHSVDEPMTAPFSTTPDVYKKDLALRS